MRYISDPREYRLNQPGSYEELNESQKEALGAWIAKSFEPALADRSNRTSYWLKHDFEVQGGFYVTNGQFKGAMLAAGYEPIDRDELNWSFGIRLLYDGPYGA